MYCTRTYVRIYSELFYYFTWQASAEWCIFDVFKTSALLGSARLKQRVRSYLSLSLSLTISLSLFLRKDGPEKEEEKQERGAAAEEAKARVKVARSVATRRRSLHRLFKVPKTQMRRVAARGRRLLGKARREIQLASAPATTRTTQCTRRKMRSLGLEIIPMDEDGNCLFRALGYQLSGKRQDHADVRHAIASGLKSAEEQLAPSSTQKKRASTTTRRAWILTPSGAAKSSCK